MRLLLSIISALVANTAADHWTPTAGESWQIVLSENLQPPYPSGVSAIDGDLYSNPASTWSSIKSSGIKTICYFSAGSYEDWRPDASQFDKATDLGSPLQGWKGEWWLNTKSDNVRRIMASRLDLAKQNGCDAVDPDNVDAYDNDNGLGLTEDDAVSYVRFLAAEAHNRSMAVGLKNAGAIVGRVLDVVDFQVNEQCEKYDECDQFRPFINADKPVFGIEYTKDENTIPSRDEVSTICNNPSSKGFSTVIKHMSLNSWLISCKTTATSNSTSNQTMSTMPSATPTDGGNDESSAHRTRAGVVIVTVALAAAFAASA